MDSNAPGQLLGYALQVPRALVHLLKGGPGDTVCVEVLGDVATSMADDNLIAEEDKSSVSSNPLTDRSTDLWKTFYNWITAVNEGEIDIHKTTFILYSNKSGRPGIVNTFHSATTKEEARNAISAAKTKLADVKSDHDIWRFYDYVVNQNADQLVEVIRHFELQIGSGAGLEEVHNELVRRNLYASQIPFLGHRIHSTMGIASPGPTADNDRPSLNQEARSTR